MARVEQTRKVKNETVHRYILQPYTGPSSRVTCPNCGVKHSYARYVDVTTGTPLDDRFGRCERQERCGYFEHPYGKDIGEKTIFVQKAEVKAVYKDIESSDISIIDPGVLLKSLTLSDNFSKFLFGKFDHSEVTKSLLKYKVGQSEKWDGATVFWQIDREMDIRTGKIILYNVDSGKRVKEPFAHMFWEHSPDRGIEVIPDYNLKQCLFGEHLLEGQMNINIVESEKTAVICDINSTNDDLWLAVGGIELISEKRLQVLEGRKLNFYPDKGDKAYNKWKEKLTPLMEQGWDIKINRGLEKTSLDEGEDLADYILTNLE